MCFIKNIRKIIANAELEQCILIFLKFFLQAWEILSIHPDLPFWGIYFVIQKFIRRKQTLKLVEIKALLKILVTF